MTFDPCQVVGIAGLCFIGGIYVGRLVTLWDIEGEK